jgi:K+-transporting ATPase ATPase C chain
MAKITLQSILMLLVMTVVTGVLYPLAITLAAQTVFPNQANGSLIKANGKVIGSALLGQKFSQDKYFLGRPSATGSYPYNAAGSGGSNLGPTNEDLIKQMKERCANFEKTNHGTAKIPIDLITSSASGLDPHISLEAAEYQVQRVANARNIDVSEIRNLVAKQREPRQWLFFGEPRVNVLKLNLALDEIK